MTASTPPIDTDKRAAIDAGIDAADQADIHAVEASLDAWHHALAVHDWTAAAAGLTANFLMIEHDRIMDKDALLAFLVDSGTRGRQRANLRGFRTTVAGDCAWTTVYNDELWIANDGSETPFNFLETAVFRRMGDAWLIARYHATHLVAHR